MRYMGGVIHQQTQDSHYDDDDYYSQICVYNTILHSGPPVTQLSQKNAAGPAPHGLPASLAQTPWRMGCAHTMPPKSSVRTTFGRHCALQEGES